MSGEYARLSNDDSMRGGFYSDQSYKAFDPNYSLVSIDIVKIKTDTHKACKISVKKKSGGIVDLWFPKKQCRIKGGKISLPKWLFDLKNKELNKQTLMSNTAALTPSFMDARKNKNSLYTT